MNLPNLPNLLKSSNTLAHDGSLPYAIVDLLYCDRGSRAGVDNTLVILNRGECAAVIKNGPVLLYQGNNCDRIGRGKVGD